MEVLFKLGEIPSELLFSVTTKVSGREYGRLNRTCKSIHNLLASRRNLVRVHFSNIHIRDHVIHFVYTQNNNFLSFSHPSETTQLRPFRIHCKYFYIDPDVTETILQEWLAMVLELKITCEQIYISEKLACSPSSLQKLFVLTKATLVFIKRTLSKALFPPSMFNGANEVRLVDTDYGNQEICLLRQPRIEMEASTLGNLGIRRIVREWYAGERDIQEFFVATNNQLDAAQIVEDLPVSLLYNRESHAISTLKDVEESALPLTVRNHFFYVLTRPDSIYDVCILDVSPPPPIGNYVRIIRDDQPQTYLHRLVKRWRYPDHHWA